MPTNNIFYQCYYLTLENKYHKKDFSSNFFDFWRSLLASKYHSLFHAFRRFLSAWCSSFQTPAFLSKCDSGKTWPRISTLKQSSMMILSYNNTQKLRSRSRLEFIRQFFPTIIQKNTIREIMDNFIPQLVSKKHFKLSILGAIHPFSLIHLGRQAASYPDNFSRQRKFNIGPADESELLGLTKPDPSGGKAGER